MSARIAAAALASAVVAGAVGCGAAASAPVVPAAPDTSDAAEGVATYLIDARMIDTERDAVVSNPRIMTLEGEPARITTAMTAPGGTDENGDETYAEAAYDMELVVTTCGGAQCLAGGLVIDAGARRGEWAFQMMVSDGDTVAFTLEEPLPLRYEVTIGRVSGTDGTVAHPAAQGEREAAMTTPLVWSSAEAEPPATPLRAAPEATPPASAPSPP